MRSDPTSLRRAMITVPFRPSLRPSTDIEGSVGGSQVHSASAPAPAHTVPGSLGFAGGVLVPFAAFEVMSSSRQYSQGVDRSVNELPYADRSDYLSESSMPPDAQFSFGTSLNTT